MDRKEVNAYADVADISVIEACLLQRGDWMDADELRNAIEWAHEYKFPSLRSSRYGYDPLNDQERANILAEAERRARERLADYGSPREIDADLLRAELRAQLQESVRDAESFDYKAYRRADEDKLRLEYEDA